MGRGDGGKNAAPWGELKTQPSSREATHIRTWGNTQRHNTSKGQKNRHNWTEAWITITQRKRLQIWKTAAVCVTDGGKQIWDGEEIEIFDFFLQRKKRNTASGRNRKALQSQASSHNLPKNSHTFIHHSLKHHPLQLFKNVMQLVAHLFKSGGPVQFTFWLNCVISTLIDRTIMTPR